LYRLVARVMNADLPGLILGESGTGKSLLARTIHDLSDRAQEPFVTVRGAEMALPDAPARLLDRAGAGTLFLDEIADFDTDAQAQLVRLLDGLGAGGPRILTSSQVDLSDRLASGQLRADLFYRLDGVRLFVPPLRERVEDIALLTRHFLARAEASGLGRSSLAPAAIQHFQTHSWPGNVRQLENTIRQLVVTATGPEISAADCAAVLGAQDMQSVRVDEGEKLATSVARHLSRYFALHVGILPPPGLYDRVLREIEAPLLEIALDATAGNQAKCADLLGINRNTLRKKLTELDIRVTRRRKLM
ncbi:MAG: sigma 54-interacting transcriptional regulator, partial [Paracoccaceae bacterium]